MLQVRPEGHQQSWGQEQGGEYSVGACLHHQSPIFSAIKQGKSQPPWSHLLSLLPGHCDDVTDPFNQLTLRDDSQILHSSCLQ